MKGAPAAPVHENLQQALSINRAPNMRNPPKKPQHNVFSADSSIQQKRRVNEKKEDPFLCPAPVTERWLTVGWNGHCRKSPVTNVTKGGRTKEDQGYVSFHGPWEPSDGLPLLVTVLAPLTSMNNPSLWVQSSPIPFVSIL